MPHRVPKLKIVEESQATGRVGEIFEDWKATLGVPYVAAFFRSYAPYPDFLEFFWTQLKPVARHPDFFKLADRLRADAYTRVYSYFSVPDYCRDVAEMQLSAGARAELTRTVELLHFHNPAQLLIAAAALQAFDRVTGHNVPEPAIAEIQRSEERPVLISEEAATPRVARIYDDIKRTIGSPVVNSDYRAFARFPDFLEDFWKTLKPILESPIYTSCHTSTRDDAVALSREIPGKVDLTKERLEKAGIEDDTIAQVVRATELFVKIVSGLLLNVTIAKIGLEGGTASRRKATNEAAGETGATTGEKKGELATKAPAGDQNKAA